MKTQLMKIKLNKLSLHKVYLFISILGLMLSGCGSGENSTASASATSFIVEELEKSGLSKGDHYQLLKPGVQHEDAQLIVTEYFWYGCSHCYHAEPLVKEWKESLPEGAKIVRVPVVWRTIMKLHAQVFYTSEALANSGQLSSADREKLHESLFPVIMNLRSEKDFGRQRTALQNHFQKFDIQAELFNKTMESDEVAALVKQAADWQKLSDIQGTPSFVVNGIYKIDTEKLEGDQDLISVGNQIINIIKEITRQS